MRSYRKNIYAPQTSSPVAGKLYPFDFHWDPRQLIARDFARSARQMESSAVGHWTTKLWILYRVRIRSSNCMECRNAIYPTIARDAKFRRINRVLKRRGSYNRNQKPFQRFIASIEAYRSGGLTKWCRWHYRWSAQTPKGLWMSLSV